MITNRKITSWETPVSAEADRPQRTASEMKAVFDGNSEQLRVSVNGLIDDLTGSAGAESIGSPSLPGIVANGLWAQIVAFFAKVFGIVRTDQPSNRYLNGAGQYTVPSVGAAANGLPLGGNDNDFLLKNGNPDFATKWQSAVAVRSRLNVADGADITEAAIATADEAEALADTDVVPVLQGGLKRATVAIVVEAIRTALFSSTSGMIKLNEGAVESAVAGTDYTGRIDASGILIGDGSGGVSAAAPGTDYIAPPNQLTELPASGTALQNNAEYRVAAAVGTYAFAWPAGLFEVWLTFTTSASPNITFPGGTKYIASSPTFKATTTYEMSVKNAVVVCQEVKTA